MNWVLGLDIPKLFDEVSHEWLVKFIAHRIGDRRGARLLPEMAQRRRARGWTTDRAGESDAQGGCASPLLANVYLHYVFDLWVQAWRQKRAHGNVIVVRFADDIVVGFNCQANAEQFRAY